jgi:hypothetical protein
MLLRAPEVVASCGVDWREVRGSAITAAAVVLLNHWHGRNPMITEQAEPLLGEAR